MDKVYITGHRNPDTDSIVSAIAYAALKNALGQRQYCAARLGQISDETQAVLDRFDAKAPELINNVRTQVRDLDFDTPPTLSAAATISRAWQTMQADRISVLPVANEDGTLYGMLSAGDVASYDMLAVRNSTVKNVPVYNLLSVLEGKVLNEGGQIRDEISGEVTIALPAGRENLLFSSPDSIVVCGDQPDIGHPLPQLQHRLGGREVETHGHTAQESPETARIQLPHRAMQGVGGIAAIGAVAAESYGGPGIGDHVSKGKGLARTLQE